MEGDEVVVDQIPSTVDYTTPISVTVSEPILDETETFSHFTYLISGSDANGIFNIRRRYSDFDHLRKKLALRWAGIYVPPIAGKRSDKNPLHIFRLIEGSKANKKASEQRYAQTRKRFLDYFCSGVALRPYLFYCDLFQVFLRGGDNYEGAISGLLSKEYGFLLQAYQNNFKALMQSVEGADWPSQLELNQQHLATLRESEQRLNNVSELICKAIESREQFNQQFNVVMEQSIIDYEQKVFLNHVGKDRQRLIFTRSEEIPLKVIDHKTTAQNNPLQQYLEFVNYELRENKAFIEAIQGRKEAQKRRIELKEKIEERQKEMDTLANGGFTWRSVLRKGSKELQGRELQVKREVLKKQENCISEMIVVMVANSNYEIQQYRLRRGKEYQEMVRSISIREQNKVEMYGELLALISAAL